MALQIELKPNERVIIGDCVITNAGQRARLKVEGKVPILREKDVMRPGQANTRAKRIYLAVQRMYVTKETKSSRALYQRLVREMLKVAPDARPFIASINNRILTGDLYKALKEARKLIAYEKELLDMHYASKAYAAVAKETASPRELEASLLLKAAAKLQAVHDCWSEKPSKLDDALTYNRRLWTVFLDAVIRDDSLLPISLRQNLANLGTFVMSETFSMMTAPQPRHLASLIKINRGIAAGLRSKA